MNLVESMKNFMSLSEIAISWGVNSRTITRYAKKMFPDEFKKKEQTLLNNKKVALLKIELEKHNLLNTRDLKKEGFISARTSKATEDYFRENKKLMGSGSVSAIVLDIFPMLYSETVNNLKKNFNREELLIILTSFKGKVGHPSEEYSRLKPIKNDKFKDFDLVTLNIRFLTLSFSDRFIIELWANKFWNGVTVGGVRNTTDDPEDYIR